MKKKKLKKKLKKSQNHAAYLNELLLFNENSVDLANEEIKHLTEKLKECEENWAISRQRSMTANCEWGAWAAECSIQKQKFLDFLASLKGLCKETNSPRLMLKFIKEVEKKLRNEAD